MATTKKTTAKTTAVQPTPDPEIRPKAVRSQWSARERLRILAAADACPPGEIGALLRREGIYSSHLSRWRRQRAQGELDGLEPKRRAAPSPEARAQAAEEAAANDAIKWDPEVKKWVYAAVLENSAQN